MASNGFGHVAKLLVAVVVASLITTGCSTSGGMYKKGDSKNGGFSLGRTLLVLGAVAATVAVASNGGGQGLADGLNSGSSGADWDEFYDENYRLVWVCRDIATAQFTNTERCAGKYQSDTRWPSKQRPGR